MSREEKQRVLILSVCPFDYTALAVNEKADRS